MKFLVRIFRLKNVKVDAGSIWRRLFLVATLGGMQWQQEVVVPVFSPSASFLHFEMFVWPPHSPPPPSNPLAEQAESAGNVAVPGTDGAGRLPKLPLHSFGCRCRRRPRPAPTLRIVIIIIIIVGFFYMAIETDRWLSHRLAISKFIWLGTRSHSNGGLDAFIF